jgi:nicotinamide-nucleotide amidase
LSIVTCSEFLFDGIIGNYFYYWVYVMKDSIANLATQLGQVLLSKNWQISCAESCTGGGIAYAITSTAGSSAWFNRSFVTYSNEAKRQLLNVKTATLEQYGAVSRQTVLEMASGTAKVAAANVALSVSGIAGPDGGSEEKPVGTVWFGFCVGDVLISEKVVFSGDRGQVREQAIEHSLSKALQLLAEVGN